MDFINTDVILGLASGIIINFLPFINRRLDKLTSSQAGKIGFFIIETLESFGKGKITKAEVDDAIAQLKTIIDQYEKNRTNQPNS